MNLKIDLFWRIRLKLAKLFFRKEDAESMVLTLRLPVPEIEFDFKAINTWTSILSYAEDEDKIEPLLERAIELKPNDPDLPGLLEEVRRDGYIQTDYWPVVYEPYVAGSPVKIAFIYEPPLRRQTQQLSNQLAVYRFDRLLDCYDWMDSPGSLGCQIALFFLTPRMLGSKRPFFPAALQLQRSGVRTVPLLISPCDWENLPPFKGKKPLPDNGKFVTDKTAWPDGDGAWLQIAKGVKWVAESLRNAAGPVRDAGSKNQ
jgi:hypothetical protein